jgi:hypothetical protein
MNRLASASRLALLEISAHSLAATTFGTVDASGDTLAPLVGHRARG